MICGEIMEKYNVDRGIVELAQGSITRYEAEALVCPANGDLEMVAFSGGVQYAFLSDGGKEIFEEARKIAAEYYLNHKERFGEIGHVPDFSAHLTSAGRLPAKHVVHSVAVGMKRDGSGLYCNEEVIGESTRNALDLARETGLASIGFPALGTGLYSVPLEEAVEAMGEEFQTHLSNGSSIERIGLILYSSQEFDVGRRTLNRMFR
jgi:O-acetyl-ADP-ribose deacetylase (regulator of RNase III)